MEMELKFNKTVQRIAFMFTVLTVLIIVISILLEHRIKKVEARQNDMDNSIGGSMQRIVAELHNLQPAAPMPAPIKKAIAEKKPVKKAAKKREGRA